MSNLPSRFKARQPTSATKLTRRERVLQAAVLAASRGEPYHCPVCRAEATVLNDDGVKRLSLEHEPDCTLLRQRRVDLTELTQRPAPTTANARAKRRKRR